MNSIKRLAKRVLPSRAKSAVNKLLASLLPHGNKFQILPNAFQEHEKAVSSIYAAPIYGALKKSQMN